MVLKTIRSKIRETFSEAAFQYDVLSSLHREIGRELTANLQSQDVFSSILDIGMGTGWFTKRLKNHFPEAGVVGIDFADGMIEQAKSQDSDFKIIQADAANLPFQTKSFDLITSNLAYQWVEDLNQGFKSCHSLLKNDGVLEMTLFGYQTLDELFVSIEKSLNKDACPFKRLPTYDFVKDQLINVGFKDVDVHYERIKVRFPDMMALVKWIKGIGANALQRDIYVGKDLLNRASQYYNEHFSDHLGAFATFEVVWVKARK